MANTKRPSDYNNDGVSIQNILVAFEAVLSEDIYSKYFPINSQERYKISTLFQIALSNMNTLFPNVRVKQSSTDPKDYIKKWLANYTNDLITPPSQRIAKLPSSAVDPALGIMVQERLHLSDDDIIEKSDAHRLFMSAENIQGSLLEEYIASIAEPQGWIWARGETLRACDFVKSSNIITTLIQIKNRDNTENSSSSAIRNGTQIQKWFRLKSSHKNGKPYPSFMWDKLNEIMQLGEQATSEEDYRHFLKQVVSNNPNVIRN